MSTPEQILAVALKLLDPKGTEAEWRAAAGRAYYAVFHHVSGALGIDQGKGAGRSHQLVGDALLSEGLASPPDIVTAKKVWGVLKSTRETADYQLSSKFEFGIAVMAVELATKVLAANK
jgi:uncharacterized protein (UPF0332 family)